MHRAPPPTRPLGAARTDSVGLVAADLWHPARGAGSGFASSGWPSRGGPLSPDLPPAGPGTAQSPGGGPPSGSPDPLAPVRDPPSPLDGLAGGISPAPGAPPEGGVESGLIGPQYPGVLRALGYWGGSAHYPDPTAQSAPAPRKPTARANARDPRPTPPHPPRYRACWQRYLGFVSPPAPSSGAYRSTRGGPRVPRPRTEYGGGPWGPLGPDGTPDLTR